MRRPGPRPRGRPALAQGEPSIELCLNLTRAAYDALAEAAIEGDTSVQGVIRVAIARLITARRRRPRQTPIAPLAESTPAR